MGETFGLPGVGESHVMPVFADMDERWTAYTSRFRGQPVMAARLDAEGFRGLMAQFIRDAYAAEFPAGRWVDKTPGVIAGLPLILAAFPGARILLTRRTGTETVASHIAKFREPFAIACRKWQRSMAGLIAARTLPPNVREAVLEVEQFDMANAADATGARIAAHLGAPGQAAALAACFHSRQVEATATHDRARRLTLNDTGWSSEQRQVFVSACGAMMETLGYPM